MFFVHSHFSSGTCYLLYLPSMAPSRPCNSPDCTYHRNASKPSNVDKDHVQCAICRISERTDLSDFTSKELGGITATIASIKKCTTRQTDIDKAFAIMAHIGGMQEKIEAGVANSIKQADKRKKAEEPPRQADTATKPEENKNSNQEQEAEPAQKLRRVLPSEMLNQGRFGYCSMYALASAAASAMCLKYGVFFEPGTVLEAWFQQYCPVKAQWPNEPCQR